MKKNADPCPTEILGVNLRAGMITFQRVIDKDGNVKFREDHRLVALTGLCKPSGIHFRTNKGQVCYWTGGKVWVKVPSESEEASTEDSR